jgi:hypothetical protein
LAQLRGYGEPEAVTIVGVDGRSGSGKSTLAGAVAAMADDVVILHFDDIAWHHCFFDWHQLLIDDILKPLRRHGPPLSHRPDAWNARGHLRTGGHVDGNR